MMRLAAARRRRSVGTAAHSPASSCRRNSSIRRCSSSRELDVALRDQHLTMPGLHPQKAHDGIMSKRRGVAGHARPDARRRRPSTSTGPAPAPTSRRPSRTARRRAAWRRAPPPAASSPERQPRRQHRGVRAARTRARRRRGSARRAARRARSPSKNTSIACSRWPPVTTTHARAERVDGARQLARPSSVAPAPGQRRAPRAGSASPPCARGSSSSISAAARVGRRAARRRTRRPSPGRARPACRREQSSSARATASIVATVAEHPDLDRVDADVARRPRAPGRRSSPARSPATAVTADGVLRRDRRDRGHPVHAAGGERLQVGLDAGAAAGVRAGDRQHARDPRSLIGEATSAMPDGRSSRDHRSQRPPAVRRAARSPGAARAASSSAGAARARATAPPRTSAAAVSWPAGDRVEQPRELGRRAAGSRRRPRRVRAPAPNSASSTSCAPRTTVAPPASSSLGPAACRAVTCPGTAPTGAAERAPRSPR